MLVTFSGITILCSELQFENAPVWMAEIFSDKSISRRLLQYANVYGSIDVIPVDMTIFLRREQPKKAEPPRVRTLLGRTMFWRLLQPLKALVPIEIKLSGRITL